MKLPESFVQTMRELLQEEAAAFFASYDLPRAAGIRANGLKLDPQRLPEVTGLARDPVPWAPGGYYTDEEERPGKHPYYYLGLYYIQEPSAMLPAEMLDVQPGHRVLDLCAAPGGKSTQLAAKLQGEGVLVSNDNAPERAKALAKNIEMAGVRNAVVLCEQPGRIAERFGAWFDRVLVDAPCSGEGMFRKEPDMIRQWERRPSREYVSMQLDILRDAARMVAPGGRLVYSTCTFSPRENEGVIARFLAEFPEFSVIPAEAPGLQGLSPGRPDWLDEEEKRGLEARRSEEIRHAVRIWPHLARGEGHFAALLERRAEDEALADKPAVVGAGAGGPTGTWGPAGMAGMADTARKQAGRHRRLGKGRDAAADQEEEARAKWAAFLEENMPGWAPPGTLLIRGNMVYSQPEGLPDLQGLNVIRPGWLLGAAAKHRFQPSQAMAMGLTPEEFGRNLELSSDHPDGIRYLKGETLQPPAGVLQGKGWTLVCLDGFPAGWGRWDGVTLKNERQPGWRLI
jgi:16S rRNA C967 or C1407 C5-methylase (RsmB/RsmF family)/NOL1/NOP2/fmu family ribosome biogenesis protein